MEQLIENIERSLRLADFIIRIKGRTILKKYDMTGPQFRALQALIAKNDQMTIGDLSESMQIAYSTVTDLINRMEKLGYVKKSKDDNDGRIVRVSVLEKGHEIVREVVRVRREFIRETLKALSKEEHEELERNLNRFYEELKRGRDND